MSDVLTPVDTAELRALLEKATPGPWRTQFNEKGGVEAVLGRRGDGNVRLLDGLGGLFHIDCATREDMDNMFPAVQPEMRANAALIVAVVNALPGILAEIDRARSAQAGVPEGWREAIEAAYDVGVRAFERAEAPKGIGWHASDEHDAGLNAIAALLSAAPPPPAPAAEDGFSRGVEAAAQKARAARDSYLTQGALDSDSRFSAGADVASEIEDAVRALLPAPPTGRQA